MRAAAAERLELERDLAGALARRELRLVYQPVVVLDESKVTGFEALIRWDHPTYGTLLPERFIPIAEESGLIDAIGRWVLIEACRAAAQWRRNYLGGEALGQVRALGVRIAIDDFGTGYSSLGYLRRFPVDILKIDRSFVSTIDELEVPPMVRGLLDLGRTLDLVMIAEGVELDFQAQLLRDNRCTQAQGLYFAKPLEPQEVELLLLQQTAGSLGL